jgi:two-component system OmpR family sensor kinase
VYLNVKARAVLRNVVAGGLILAAASVVGDWVFSGMVLGQFDQSLVALFKLEASSALADAGHPPRVHELAPDTAPPSFPRLDKFIQIVDLEGRVVAKSANLGTARLPTAPLLLARLRAGEQVLESLKDFGDEPVRLFSGPIEVGGIAYAIQVAGSLDDANATLRSARVLFLAMSAAILAASGLTGAMLAGSILRPIDRIVTRARVMGSSALIERLPHPGGRDEMARLVETLNALLDRIEQMFEVQRRFTADASQELRSPLSRLRAELEVTLRRPRPRVEYEEALSSCLLEVERLSRLTEELLTLARLDAGESRESPQAVPLLPIMQDAVAHATPEALRREVNLTLDTEPEVVAVVAPAAARVVVDNLLDNAVKFSPRGGTVRVQASSWPGAAVIAVSDSGPGIPAHEIPRLFERFYRGSAARQSDTPGVGLGLAICRAVVERQGGTIAVSSTLGGGTAVSVSLPLALGNRASRRHERPTGLSSQHLPADDRANHSGTL